MHPPRLLLLLPSLAAATTTTLVDILAQSPHHTHLTHLLQRARLIPTLNRLAHATLFAPTNDALARAPYAAWLAEADADADDKHPDNLQLALRQRLLYHILNVSLIPTPPLSSSSSPATTFATILYPLPEDPDKYPGLPGDDPQPSKQGLLGPRPQRIRIATTAASTSVSAGPVVVGVDSDGNGGVATFANGTRVARNGLFVPLDGFLLPPPPLADVIASHPRLSLLASLLSNDTLAALADDPHVTLLAPSNDAFDALGSLEKAYLASKLAQDDVISILTAHTVNNTSDVNWVDDFGHEATPVAVGSGGDQRGEDTLNVTRRGSQLVIADVESLESNVFANNGVVHILPKLMLPGHTFSITVEKALIALNCTKFVSLFRANNLTHYLAGSTSPDAEKVPPYTILAVHDDILKDHSTADWSNKLPPEGSDALVDSLEYHVLNGKWSPQDLRDGMLLGTELIIKKRLSGHRQRVSVSVSANDGHGGDKAKGLVGFGGSSVLAEPVVVGSSIIYLMSKTLELPANPIEVAVSQLSLSTFVASTYAAGLDSYLTSYPAVTFFIPSNPSFERLGLMMKYLLLPNSKDSLRRLIEYHIVDEIVYLDETRKGVHEYQTLEGAKLTLSKGEGDKWSNVTVRGPLIPSSNGEDDKEGVNGEQRGATVVDGDWLTSTGAIHVVDQVEVAPSLNISIGHLVKGSKQTTMIDLIRQTNMTWILNGSDPPAEFDLEYLNRRHQGRRRRSYTLLVPTDTAFTRINLTYYTQDQVRLTSLVLQHILPTPDDTSSLNGGNGKRAVEWGSPLSFEEGTTLKSLLSMGEWGRSLYGDISFRHSTSSSSLSTIRSGQVGRGIGSKSGDEDGVGQWIVGIKGAQGTRGQHDAGHILELGRCTPHYFSPTLGDDTISKLKIQTQHSASVKSSVNDGHDGEWVSGGGVILLDSVLEPYDPSWWQRWSWIFGYVGLVVVGLGVTGGIGYGGFFFYKRRKNVTYERVQGQED